VIVTGRPFTRHQVESQLGAIAEGLWYSAATRLSADLLVSHRTPAWLYRVSARGFTQHGHDVPLWNGTPRWHDAAAPRGVRASDKVTDKVATAEPSAEPGARTLGGEVGSAAMGFLCNFARTGDPNGPGLPTWTPHTHGAEQYMELGPQLGMGTPSEPQLSLERARFALLSEYLLRERGEAA
jgi:para-nitrobenzyl esterase